MLVYFWLVLIASCNYGTHTVIIGERYAAHLVKTRKKSIFSVTFFFHPPFLCLFLPAGITFQQ